MKGFCFVLKASSSSAIYGLYFLQLCNDNMMSIPLGFFLSPSTTTAMNAFQKTLKLSFTLVLVVWIFCLDYV